MQVGLEFFEPVFDGGDAFGVLCCHGSDDVLDGFGFVAVVVVHDGVDFGGGVVFVSVFDCCFQLSSDLALLFYRLEVVVRLVCEDGGDGGDDGRDQLGDCFLGFFGGFFGVGLWLCHDGELAEREVVGLFGEKVVEVVVVVVVVVGLSVVEVCEEVCRVDCTDGKVRGFLGDVCVVFVDCAV